MYRTPTLEAVSLILAFIASPEAGTAPVTYRIDATMDVIVSLSNPNDIPTVWPASVPFRTETEGFPYTPKWNIHKARQNTVSYHPYSSSNQLRLVQILHPRGLHARSGRGRRVRGLRHRHVIGERQPDARLCATWRLTHRR